MNGGRLRGKRLKGGKLKGKDLDERGGAAAAGQALFNERGPAGVPGHA